jgi:two-component sensor histidine kinase
MRQRHIWRLAAAAFTILCGVAVTATIWRDRLNTHELIVRDTAARADQIASHAEQGLTNAVIVLARAAEVVGRLDPAAEVEVGPLRTRLDDMVVGNSAIGTLWVVSPDGFTWVNNNTEARLSTDVSREIYYTALRQDPSALVVGPSAIGTVVKRPRFPLARAIVDDRGRFAGAVVAGIDQAFLGQIYTRVRQNSAVALMAFNSDGDVLAMEPALDAAAVERARSLLRVTDGPVPREIGGWYYEIRRLGSAPVTLMAATDLEAGYADWRSRSIRLALLGALMTAGFLALTVQGLRAVGREERATADLRGMNETLEARVRERTRTVELLFRELNHRVKNNLQIIASLLRLQMRKSKDPDLKATLQDSVNRVFAIADVHGEIEGGKDGSVALESYVGKIVRRICDAMQKPGQTIDVQLDVEDAELSLDRAVLVAIAINETVTNAFKHAFNGRTTGRLTVAVAMEGANLLLSVTNDVADGDGETADGPAPSSGMGSSILEMLVQQMAGTLNVERTDGSYCVRIAVPVT